MEAVSRFAPIARRGMNQTCTVYKFTGNDPSGQPQYAQGTEWPCRVAVRTERSVSDTGDLITNSTAVLILPADCDIQAYDQIDMPSPYRQGAVVREVVTATDYLGQVTHRAVRIL
ncbi:MAG: hypothetical protein IJI97_00300 [Clostridia bacterium]|nr:hypothetical protein [Clostridia bacterium]